MVTYTSAFLAAANLLAVAQAAPAWSDNGAKCQVVVDIIEGPGIWVPSPDATASWSSWDPKATTTTTPAAAAWSSWTTSASAKATTDSFGGGFWSHSTTSTSTASVTTTTWTGHPTTTAAPTTTTTTTSTTTTTTTTTSSAPTCAASTYDFDYSPSGSCGCDFTVDCNVHAGYTASTKFWEQTTGQLVDTLAQCIQMCNDNSACQATVWSAQDPSDTQDYKRCWQISGLGADASTGFGQISRKGSCSGTCSSNYSS